MKRLHLHRTALLQQAQIQAFQLWRLRLGLLRLHAALAQLFFKLV